MIPSAQSSSGRHVYLERGHRAGGPIAVAIGGLAMHRVGAVDFALGPRVAFSFAILCYALGAFLLRPVDERRRE